MCINNLELLMQKHILTLVLLSSTPFIATAASTQISKSQFKEKWPLAVSQGTLNCEPVPGAIKVHNVTFTTNGTTYALNGIARGHAKTRGWREINEIWLNNPAIPGTKFSIGPLINSGLALCK